MEKELATFKLNSCKVSKPRSQISLLGSILIIHEDLINSKVVAAYTAVNKLTLQLSGAISDWRIGILKFQIH